MQRLDIAEIKEIKIPRQHLQNPHNEDSLLRALGTDASLTWIGNTIEAIEQLTSNHLIVVDDTDPLNESESAMLQAIQGYVAGHINNAPFQAARPASPHDSSPAAAAADGSCFAPADDHTCCASITTAAAASQTAASIIALASNDTSISETEDEYPDDEDEKEEDEKGEYVTPAAPLAADATTERNAAIMSVINSILKLDIWKSKGKGFFGYKLPTGIDSMQKLESPTITGLADIARTQLAENKLTRTGMTGRFYNMIVDLDQLGMTPANREERLMKYATDELIANAKIANSWSVGKVLLPDTDHTTLCDISGIDNTPEAIAALVATAPPTADADADAAPQTGPHL